MTPTEPGAARSNTWQGKVALVTGGSAGLGLAIAKAFARHGASIVIAARGKEALDAAAAQLRALGVDVLAMPADITRDEDVAALVDATIARFGRLDVLVNNAGRSTRGRAIDTTPAQFQEMWELNFLALVRMTQAAMPHLLKSQGNLVNIGSLAGKSAARWIGAYPATKFAVSAYTQQLRLELGPEGLHTLLVSPGPIARTEPHRYDASSTADLPESARRPGGGVQVKAIDPDWLAQRIVTACERRDSELVVPAKARLLFAIAQLSPKLGDWLIRRNTS